MLEAALLFPLVLMVTVALVFAGLFAGVQSTALSAAGLAADRAAFAWDNSKRNPVTGAFLPGQYDDLYWRLTGDHSSSPLAARKVKSALATVGTAGKEGRYDNAVWRRKVSVEATLAFHAPDWLPVIGKADKTRQRSEAIVTDPAEWVRTVGTVKLYWPLVRNAVSPQQAEQMVEEFRKRPGAKQEPLAFANHDQAVDYLRQLVGGGEKRINTEEVGHYRKIEAYDRHGVAHHAYLGSKTTITDIRNQYLKDEELLKKGLVKGVVWHFFRREDTGAIGPSEELRKQLERRGIVIVIHE